MESLKLHTQVLRPISLKTQASRQNLSALPESPIVRNPFEPKKDLSSAKQSQVVVKLPSSVAPAKANLPLQTALDAAEVLPKACEASVKVSQKTVDSLSQNFNKFKVRIKELEREVEMQSGKLEQSEALNKQQETEITQLRYDLRHACRSIATQKVRLDEEEKKRNVLENSIVTIEEERNASLQAKSTENTSLSTELSTMKEDLEKALEVVKEQKAKLLSAENQVGKVQAELIVARQRTELARQDAKDSKQAADNAHAIAEKAITTQFEDKVTKLEAQLKDNTASVQHERAVMLQSQVDDLTAKHEKEVFNLAKAHARIVELEQNVESGADRRARREEQNRLKMSLEFTERELRTSEAAVKIANGKVKTLSNAVSTLNSERDTLSKALETSKAELARLESLSRVNDEVRELKEKLTTLESAALQKDSRINEAGVSRQQQRQKIASMMSQMAELQRQASLSQQTNASLTNELQALRARHSSMLSECLAKTDKLRELETTMYDAREDQLQLVRTGDDARNNLSKEIHRLKSQRGQDHKYISELEQDLHSQQDYMKNLKREVRNLNKNLMARSQSMSRC